MDLSVRDSIKLGEVLLLAVGVVEGMSCCGGTGCLSCQAKQSTSNPWCADCFVPVLLGVGLRGACMGLCVMLGTKAKTFAALVGERPAVHGGNQRCHRQTSHYYCRYYYRYS